MKLFSLYITWSLLIITAPFAYSESTTRSSLKSLASDLMNLLSEGNIESYRQLRDTAIKNNDVISAAKTGIPTVRTRRWKRVSKALTAVNEKGDNILHFLVRLEQSENLQQKYDNPDHLLTEELNTALFMLGPKRFLQLLIQENKERISPVLEATLSKGPAYGALKTVIEKNSYSFRGSFSNGMFAGGALAAGIALSNEMLVAVFYPLYVPDIVTTGLIVTGAGLCHKAWKREKMFQKATRHLSLPFTTL